MRIGIDARLWGQPVGVGTYLKNLVRNLIKIDKKNNYVLFVKAGDRQEAEKELKNTNFEVIVADIHWHSIAEQVNFPTLLNKFDLDLVHFPYFSVPVFYKKPFVVTVHDLTINRYATGRASTLPLPIYYGKRLGYKLILKTAIKNAKKVIVPTYSVRDDILECYPTIDATKIEVTYEGGFETRIQDLKSKNQKIEGKYFLKVGNYYPHKNVEGLISGFKLFLDERAAKSNLPKLVLVGKKDYFYERMEKLVQKLNIGSNVLFLDDIDIDELVKLYKNAVATIVPSFAEGFSLTAVEAMSLSSLVLASDIPVHREVCSDAAIFFDPKNIENIAERIGFTLDLSESSKKEMIEQGKKQASKFSWEKMAKETLKIYESAI